MAKKLALLGSSGSIGLQTLDIVDRHPERYEVWGLAVKSSVEMVREQARKYRPKVVVIFDEEKVDALSDLECDVLVGMEGLKAMAGGNYDIFVSAAPGAIAIEPTLEAIKHKKRIALANKECLVSAGELIMAAADACNAEIIPVDSEHSGLFQCLQDPNREPNKLILTASGGPFWNVDVENVSVDDALNHPTWKMGKKNSFDSSTMMNKGLEVIEAYHLFGLRLDQIEVVVHPQSLVHAMVEYKDGSLIAQIANPDMRLPIEYALNYPNCIDGVIQKYDFTKPSRIDFYPPDLEKFPCLRLAYEAQEIGGSLPCFMNATNEILVEKFLNKEISWHDVPKLLEERMQHHQVVQCKTLEEVLDIDRQARLEGAVI